MTESREALPETPSVCAKGTNTKKREGRTNRLVEGSLQALGTITDRILNYREVVIGTFWLNSKSLTERSTVMFFLNEEEIYCKTKERESVCGEGVVFLLLFWFFLPKVA